jgi:hypothetical protein
MSFRIRSIALALALAAGAAGAMASPALAADWGHRVRHERYWRHDQRGEAYAAPYAAAPYGYVVAPPPVVVAAPAPSLNFYVPLTIR